MKFALAMLGTIAAQTNTHYHITADDWYELFVDGQSLGENGNWTQPNEWTYEGEYEEGASVIAIHAKETCCNLRTQRGIVGELAGGPTRAEDWVCKYY
jgi:hypothetical protein